MPAGSVVLLDIGAGDTGAAVAVTYTGVLCPEVLEALCALLVLRLEPVEAPNMAARATLLSC